MIAFLYILHVEVVYESTFCNEYAKKKYNARTKLENSYLRSFGLSLVHHHPSFINHLSRVYIKKITIPKTFRLVSISVVKDNRLNYQSLDPDGLYF